MRGADSGPVEYGIAFRNFFLATVLNDCSASLVFPGVHI
jgi:hypothetical protein